VRDVYKCPSGNLALITTDRQSAFDRVLAAIPFKGMVLNQLAAWWFSKTTEIVANGALSQPHPNVTMALPIEVFPIEFVVRGYVTGSTDTAIWTHYKNGSRNYCGHALAEGLVKNVKLPANLCTPSTKAEHGDVPISAADIVKEGHMSKASLAVHPVGVWGPLCFGAAAADPVWCLSLLLLFSCLLQEDFDFVEDKALKLFAFGQATAAARGLILVDTKYEFGKTTAGEIVLIDEVHTPDSSRYWVAETYEARHAEVGHTRPL